MSNQIKQFWDKHNQKILFFLAFVLISTISFNAGRTHENTKKVAQIDVKVNLLEASNPKEEKIIALGEALERKGIELDEGNQSALSNHEGGESTGDSKTENKKCVFVGSKNSDKYHLPDCRYAKNIKEENKTCFSSKEDAEKKGYQPAGCCIK